MIHVYKNKYGRLEIEVVGSYQKVSTIHSKKIKDNHFFNIDDAEKIALITDLLGSYKGIFDSPPIGEYWCSMQDYQY
jgi:hypothetical protein